MNFRRILFAAGVCISLDPMLTNGPSGADAQLIRVLSEARPPSLYARGFPAGPVFQPTKALDLVVKYDLKSGGCQLYNPTKVYWQGFRDDLVAFLRRPDCELLDGNTHKVSCIRVAAMLVRASFHDAGAYAPRRGGGADGSFLISGPEDSWALNVLPLPFAPIVRAVLRPLVENNRTSWADAIAVSGAIATHVLGRAQNFTVQVGRCDRREVNPEAMPRGSATFTEWSKYWESLNISLTDAMALMGSHSLVRDQPMLQLHTTGMKQFTWGNQYFKDMQLGSHKITGQVDWRVPIRGLAIPVPQPWRYTLNDAMCAPDQMFSHCDELERVKDKINLQHGCPFASMLANVIDNFAQDKDAWETAYEIAYTRMMNVGAFYVRSPTVVTFAPLTPDPEADTLNFRR